MDQKTLLEEYYLGESKLSSSQISGRNSAISRGLSYYGCLKKKYKIHFTSFSGLHKKKRTKNLYTDFPRNLLGFIEFICYIGEVPSTMANPTVGRINHSIGYVKGNFSWQSKSDNSREVGFRVNTLVVKNIKSPKHHNYHNLEILLNNITYPIKVDNDLLIKLGYGRRKDLLRSVRDRFPKIKINKIAKDYYLIP